MWRRLRTKIWRLKNAISDGNAMDIWWEVITAFPAVVIHSAVTYFGYEIQNCVFFSWQWENYTREKKCKIGFHLEK